MYYDDVEILMLLLQEYNSCVCPGQPFVVIESSPTRSRFVLYFIADSSLSPA